MALGNVAGHRVEVELVGEGETAQYRISGHDMAGLEAVLQRVGAHPISAGQNGDLLVAKK